jgi:hypothetical protein
MEVILDTLICLNLSACPEMPVSSSNLVVFHFTLLLHVMRMWNSADCFRLAGLVNVPSLYNNQPKLKRDPIVASRMSF